ncbi:MAG: polyribonucleotide nucleotidyltransferase [Deltaproteobacteria bacterium]|nr:polyribonucleotide nucleotidyltransferase [Deltaproteobacteria bacterium]
MFEVKKVSINLGGRDLIIETGKLARQASGAVVLKYGDTIVLVTACTGDPREGQDFLPLTVDYHEKMYAAGKMPGGFFKREGRPSEKETLTSRFIDRPIRPLFPEGWICDTQIVATVLSAEHDNEPDFVAIIGASAALMLSDAPFLGPVAGCRVCRINGQLVINPKRADYENADMDLMVACSKEAIVMVEGGCDEASEEDVLAALMFAFKQLQPVIAAQEELAKLVGNPKRAVNPPVVNEELHQKVLALAKEPLHQAINIREKLPRYAAMDAVKTLLKEKLIPEDDDGKVAKEVFKHFEDLKYNIVRSMITQEKKRIDGRDLKTVRPITIETGLLPRAHGSALFTRGETQALVTVTLGIPEDVQYIDTLLEDSKKHFMLHYNFPPYSVGETKPLRGPGRREIGHGALAERSLAGVVPGQESFPYVIRIVSDILESNGSSSMASVCGGTLALMDAGVAVRSPVAGVAMGLIKEGEQYFVLTDILGDEDHLGDMDFKVTGTEKGVMAIQMDIKIGGINEAIFRDALAQAREARLHILQKMNEAIAKPKESLSPYAPRIVEFFIRKEKIREVIGSGGSVIKGIIEETGVKINIEDDGKVTIYSSDVDSLQAAKSIIDGIIEEPVMHNIYRGTVKKIMDFGAFVEILPGQDGLVHISELDNRRVNRVEDVLKEGDEVVVKVIRVDERTGKVSLSLKDAKDQIPHKERES